MVRAVVFTGPDQPLQQVRFALSETVGTAVRVRITCCTLCRSDLHTHAGRRTQLMPTILGHEIVGRIEEFGPQSLRIDARGVPVEVGDRITWAIAVGCGTCFFCADDLPQKCEKPYKYGHEQVRLDQPIGGGLADTIVLTPNTAWFRVPDTISDLVAAPANCATATVAAILRSAGSIVGRNVLVLGAGVLGLTACAMARSAGATAVFVSDPSSASRDRAMSFGATHTYSPESGELSAGIAEVTHNRGADIVLELAGVPSSVEAGMTLTRIGGTLVLAGTVAPTARVLFDPEKIVRRMLTIRGVHNYHPRDLDTALTFLAGPGCEFPFEKLVSATYSLDNVEQAFIEAHRQPGVRIAVMP